MDTCFVETDAAGTVVGYYEYAAAPADFAPPGLHALPTRPGFHPVGGRYDASTGVLTPPQAAA